MSGPQKPEAGGAIPRRRGCLLGSGTTLVGGIVLLAIVSLAAFYFLPRLIQGPLDLTPAKPAAGPRPY
jgi:hypothetical protein